MVVLVLGYALVSKAQYLFSNLDYDCSRYLLISEKPPGTS